MCKTEFDVTTLEYYLRESLKESWTKLCEIIAKKNINYLISC